MSNVLNEIKKYALKNNYTILFSALALIFLVFGIFSATKLNLGWNFLNQVLSIFPTLFWFLFFISFVGSFILAYYEKYKWMVWPIFIVLLIFTIYVRTSNIPQLKDVVTGEYTLGPDLDPFLYLRNAKEILTGTNTGKIDNMRYMPFGAPSYLRSSLMPWTIVWLYKGVSIFSNISLTYAAIIAPVLFFSISLIGFFLFTNFIFLPSLGRKKSKIAAILASFFYAFAPQMLHRTTAGIPEIESLGMAFFWFAFLFFSKAWKTKENKKIILFGALGGLFAGLMFVVLAYFFGLSDLGARIVGSPEIYAVGASGAIFALGGLLAILTPKLRVYVFFIIPMQMWVAMVVLMFVLWGISAGADLPIGNTAHFGGLLVGVIYAIYLKKRYKRKTTLIAKYFSH